MDFPQVAFRRSQNRKAKGKNVVVVAKDLKEGAGRGGWLCESVEVEGWIFA